MESVVSLGSRSRAGASKGGLEQLKTYLVDRQRGVVPNDTGQTREESPRVCRPRERRFLVPHLPAVSRHKRPYQNRNPRNRHDSALSHK